MLSSEYTMALNHPNPCWPNRKQITVSRMEIKEKMLEAIKVIKKCFPSPLRRMIWLTWSYICLAVGIFSLPNILRLYGCLNYQISRQINILKRRQSKLLCQINCFFLTVFKKKRAVETDCLGIQYQGLASFFSSKGDYCMTEKMSAQAAIYNVFPHDITHTNYQSPSSSSKNDAVFSNHQSEKYGFDFLVVPTWRGGSTALIERLNLHPEIRVVPKSEFDRAIEQQGMQSLLEKYKMHYQHQQLKIGLVQHSFIQSVRDPISLICSSYNNCLVGGRTLALSFAFICCNANTIFNRLQFELSNGFCKEYKKFKKIKIEKRNINISEPELDQIFDENIYYAMHYKVGSIYKKYFDQWFSIDVNYEFKKSKGSDIRKLIKLLGFKEPFPLSPYNELCYNPLIRLMYCNYLEMNFKTYIFHLSLGMAGLGAISSTFSLIEIYRFKHEELESILELKNTIFSLNINFDQWMLLPVSFRKQLIESKILENIMEQVIVPHWIENYKMWKATVHPFFIQELSSKQFKKVRSSISDDIVKFLNIHPEYNENWPSLK